MTDKEFNMGYIIKQSKVDSKWFAYCKKTGDMKSGSSRTFIADTLEELKEKIKRGA